MNKEKKLIKIKKENIKYMIKRYNELMLSIEQRIELLKKLLKDLEKAKKEETIMFNMLK